MRKRPELAPLCGGPVSVAFDGVGNIPLRGYAGATRFRSVPVRASRVVHPPWGGLFETARAAVAPGRAGHAPNSLHAPEAA